MSQNGYGLCLCLFSALHAGSQCATQGSGMGRQLNCPASKSTKLTMDQARTNETMLPKHTTPLRRGHPRPGAPLPPGWHCAAKRRGTNGRRRRDVAHDASRRSAGKQEPPPPSGRTREPAWVRVRSASVGQQLRRRRLPGAAGWGCYEHPPPSTCSAQAYCHMLCTCMLERTWLWQRWHRNRGDAPPENEGRSFSTWVWPQLLHPIG